MKSYQFLNIKFYYSQLAPLKYKNVFDYFCWCRVLLVNPEDWLSIPVVTILESIRIPFWWFTLDIKSFPKMFAFLS
jgi:hypothetical protein